jgi:hypothetical protein
MITLEEHRAKKKIAVARKSCMLGTLPTVKKEENRRKMAIKNVSDA